MDPPPFVAEASATGAAAADPVDARRAPERALRRTILDAAWSTVRDKHYDQALGGVNWKTVRERYEARALGAPDEPTFYRVLNEMLGELRQSHLVVTGPGDRADLAVDEQPMASGPPGDVGLVVRVIEGRPTIAEVRPGSPADRARLHAGYVVTHVAGKPLVAAPSPRPLRPVEERFHLRLAAARRLAGPIGTKVSLRVLDFQDRPADVLLERAALPGKPVTLGHLPPLHPEVRTRRVADVGVVAFNFFLFQPVLEQVQAAIDGFRDGKVRALILDLRGNPGGMGAMAIPVAARLVDRPTTLGSIQFRGFANVLTAQPSVGVKPFLGPVFLLTDEGTASTSEMLAAGLQEAGRAKIVGDTTLGAVLPSVIESLPGGAVLQYVVADFRTPKGVLVEGRGVQPDRRVLETRAALRDGRDVVLDAALTLARASAR